MRPTEMAEFMFRISGDSAQRVLNNPDQNDKINDLAAAVRDLAGGLQNMNTGLRATYILLEQVKQQQERARTARP